MSHVTLEKIERADEETFAHLETCSRCRNMIESDVDLGAVLTRILESVKEPVVDGERRRFGWLRNPWVVVPGSAVLVALAFVPLVLLGGPNEVDAGGVATTTVWPDTSSPPAPEPPVEVDSGSVEITFETDTGLYGYLLWADPAFHEGLRATMAADGPVLDYTFFQSDGGAGQNDLTVNPFEPYPTDPQGPDDWSPQPNDPSLPWSLLLNRPSVEDMWVELGGQLPLPEPTGPTHPHASQAYAAGEIRIEVAPDGLPVLVKSATIEGFSVTSLTYRDINAGEIGNNIDLPFRYSQFLIAEAPLTQRPLLFDGVVTFAEYQEAANSTAECAGVTAEFNPTTGRFSFGDDSEQLQECRSTYIADIEEVWRVQTTWNLPDFEILWARIDGDQDGVELYSATRGEWKSLGTYAMDIAERGPGYCLRYGNPGASYTEGCFTEADMTIPGVLTAWPGYTFSATGPDTPTSGEVAGLVTQQADKLVITFESGDTLEVIPGDATEFGYRGYGTKWRDPDVGYITTIDIYNGDQLIGTHKQAPPDTAAR